MKRICFSVFTLLFSCSLLFAGENLKGKDFFDLAVSRIDVPHFKHPRQNLYIWIKNPTEKEIEIEKVFVQGKNLQDILVKVPKKGYPTDVKGKDKVIWYDIVPNPIARGKYGVVRVRFIEKDKITERVEVKLVLKDGREIGSELKVIASPVMNFCSYSFDLSLAKLYLYLSSSKDVRIKNVLIDGEEQKYNLKKITSQEGIFSFVSIDTPVPLNEGEYKVIKVVADQGMNNCLVRVMKPYFPLGMYCVGHKKTGHIEEEHLKDCKEHLINCVNVGFVRTRAGKDLDILKKYRIKALYDPEWGRLSQALEKFGNDPSVLAWYVMDEPEMYKGHSAMAMIPRTQVYRKEGFPYPTAIVHCPWPDSYYEFNFTDIKMLDNYPVSKRSPDTARTDMKTFKEATSPAPCWYVAQAFSGPNYGGRHPSPEELEFMVYSAVGAGAKGIFYFNYGHFGEPCYGVGMPMEKLEKVYEGGKDKLQKDLAGIKDDARKLWEKIRWINLDLALIKDLVLKAEPIQLAETNDDKVKVLSLLSGTEAIVLFPINHNYDYKKEISVFHPVNTTVLVKLPSWFTPKDLIEVSNGKVERKKYKTAKSGVEVSISDLKVGKIFILTSNEDLFSELKGRIFDLIVPIEKAKKPIKVDGNLTDWRGIDPITLDPHYAHPGYYFQEDFQESEDLSVKVYFSWDDKHVYIGGKVRDDIHQQQFTGVNIWKEDLLQIAFDPLNNGGVGRFKEDDSEYGFALTKEGAQTYCWHNPDKGKEMQLRKDIALVVVRKAPYTIYEAAIPLEELKLGDNTVSGFNFVVDDADKEPYYEISDFLQLSPGIGWSKIISCFRKFILTE